ncbi:hypothetical protein JMJ35_002967 [Cladonia borealis]|uniref:Uncharacterized protein n=1 Tax=Cladonia borealis TaxID=184061 RepID=A0AA39V940_9LECA|nr:hypothetical protein JMJ35_002967 [Cladonia borealis]
MSADTADLQLISSLAPALLKTLLVGQTPLLPRNPAKICRPPTQVPVILGVGITFDVLAVLCFSIHVYTKPALSKNVKWDDLTCYLGYICSIVYLVGVAMGCINGAAIRHISDVYLDKTLAKSSL